MQVIRLRHGFSVTVTGKRMHGLPHSGYDRFTARGRNFSTWRGANYRRNYHYRWVIFVPLSVLAALLYQDQHYYLYTYISAPEDYCYDRTEDRYYLRWEEIETLEDYRIGQCFAFCPWQN